MLSAVTRPGNKLAKKLMTRKIISPWQHRHGSVSALYPASPTVEDGTVDDDFQSPVATAWPTRPQKQKHHDAITFCLTQKALQKRYCAHAARSRSSSDSQPSEMKRQSQYYTCTSDYSQRGAQIRLLYLGSNMDDNQSLNVTEIQCFNSIKNKLTTMISALKTGEKVSKCVYVVLTLTRLMKNMLLSRTTQTTNITTGI